MAVKEVEQRLYHQQELVNFFVLCTCYNRSMLAYIMIPFMQRELDEFRETIWNNHRIRAQKDTLMADGVPNHIFEFPEKYGMKKQGRRVEVKRI